MSASGADGVHEQLYGENSSSPGINCLRAIRQYIDKIIKPREKSKEISGMKALILDRETKGIIGIVYPMHELLEKEVYHVANIDAEREAMMHLKAIVFVRPIRENLRLLKEELANPKFAEYHIFFSNIVSQDFLGQLAASDTYGVVQQVQEFYADLFATNADLWSLNLNGSLSLSLPRVRWSKPEELLFERACQGLVASLLAFKIKPYIRYQGTSQLAQAVAREVNSTFGAERDLFGFKRPERPAVLLILDRKDDPLTPLLTQWTYQAMLHENIGIKSNRVDLSEAPGVRKNMKEVILSLDEDDFFREHMYSNYGDLGAAVKSLLDDYQSTRNMHANVQSIEDMQRFIDSYPDLRKKDHKVGKHVAIMAELNRKVETGNLFDVSEVEQSIACSDNPNEHFRQVSDLIANEHVTQYDAIRLVMIYALRYETSARSKIEDLKHKLLSEKGLGSGDIRLIDILLQYGGMSLRGGDLFGNKTMFAKLSSSVKRGVKGVENVFTQHEPLMQSIIDQLIKDKLSKALFPSAGADAPPGPPGTICIFLVGGTTYEEAFKVAALNAHFRKQKSPTRIILGSTAIHNSKSFIAELTRLAGSVTLDIQ